MAVCDGDGGGLSGGEEGLGEDGVTARGGDDGADEGAAGPGDLAGGAGD